MALDLGFLGDLKFGEKEQAVIDDAILKDSTGSGSGGKGGNAGLDISDITPPNIAAPIAAPITTAGEAAGEAAGKLGEGATEIAQPVGEVIGDVVGTVAEPVKEAADAVGGVVGTAVEGTVEAGGKAVTAAGEGIDTIGGIVGDIIDPDISGDLSGVPAFTADTLGADAVDAVGSFQAPNVDLIGARQLDLAAGKRGKRKLARPKGG